MFKTAPLPFIGQKRKFIKYYADILNKNIINKGEDWTIVDVFGGSGLLAHVAKRTKPAARVIYNDFDGYVERLQHISDTNRLRQQIASLLTGINREKALSSAEREAVQTAIAQFDGYIDLPTLASWLLFSGHQVGSLSEITSKLWYKKICGRDYPEAVGYLDGLEIRHQSYEQLLPEFLNNPKALLVLDPPYICTKQGAYRLQQHFGMVNFLRLMRFVRPPFIFFSSTRSELLDYFDFVIDNHLDGWKRLEGYQRINVNARLNYQAKYEDNLVYRF